LDYHDKSVQVCVLDRAGNVLVNHRCENDWGRIVEAVPAGTQVFAAIEACCGAADLAEELIRQANWSVALAHPGYVARMKGSPDKSDFSDARLLADLERVGYLPQVWLAPEVIRELRRLVRYRTQLVDQRRNVKLRIRALLRDHRAKPPEGINAWTRLWLAWLRSCPEISLQSRWILQQHLIQLESFNQQILEADKYLAQQVADDPVVQQLLRHAGVGLITACTLRAEIGRFDRFRTGKQLARFCSVTPRNASSGQRQADAGLVRAGSRELRRVLIEAAHRLPRLSPRWAAFRERLNAQGKPACLITAAIANRWIRGLFYDMSRLAA
jgi:transposase